MTRTRERGIGFAAIFMVAFGLLASQAPAASTWHVTNGMNTGPGSLRGTIFAVTTLDGDTIIIDAPVDPTLTSGISIDKSLTIQGAGAGTTEISNAGVGRVFTVGSVTPGAIVTLSGMTIKDGDAIDGSGIPDQNGGGIENFATLTLNGVAVTNNTAGDGSVGANGMNGSGTNDPGDPGAPGALGGDGGGVANSGTLTVTNSTITNNKAGKGGNAGDGGDGDTSGDGGDGGAGGIGGFGGGVLNLGSLTVTNSTFSNNQTGAGGAGGDGGTAGAGPPDHGNGGVGGAAGSGGAIATGGSTATISSSTLTGNLGGTGGAGGGTITNTGGGSGGLGGSGGGIGSQSAVITNVTLNGNIAGNGGNGGPAVLIDGARGSGGSGGGIADDNTTGTTITNATLSGNKAGAKGTGLEVGSDGFGGGVVATEVLRNSILVNNTVPANNTMDPTSNCAGVSTGLHNLAFPAGSPLCPSAINGNPLLGGLAANGGPTLTMALPAASPARDKIPLTGSGCPATDQRGFFRAPVAPCDIGAFERGAPASLPVTPGTAVAAVAAAPAATPAAGKKKCKKGRKLKRGKCVKKKK